MKIALALATVLAAGACGTDEASSTQASTRDPGECGSLESHVIGMNAPDENNGDSNPTIVTLQRPGRHIVVLSAVQSTFWQVKAENGAEIEKVYTFGDEKQFVKVPSGVQVHNNTRADGGQMACGFTWPPSGDCDTSVLLKLASLETAKHPTTFHGCSQASFFTIGENLATTSDCAGGAASTNADNAAKQVDLVTLCTGNEDDDDPDNDCDDVTPYYEP